MGTGLSASKTPRATKADVARLAGVSTATVSYVLNNATGRQISAPTQAAVRRAAEELGYRPNLAARNLARGGSGVILYVVPRVAVGEMPLKAGSRMTTALARRGIIQIQVFETDSDKHIVDAVADLNPIAVSSLFPLSDPVREAVKAAGIPLIEIGTLPALGEPHLSVGELRVEHLVSRGHRQLAFAYAAIPRWRPLGDFWFEGVERAAVARGLPPLQVAEVTADNIVRVVTEWLDRRVTAVCAQSDEIAFVILHGIREAGLSCPHDLAVIGVDATSTSEVSAPPLTTVEFNTEAVADVAVAGVLAELGHPDEAASPPGQIFRLIERSST